MCDCMNLVDAELKETDTNTTLDVPIVFSVGEGLRATGVLVATVKRDKGNSKKPSPLFASHCPFCGQPYKKGDAPPPQPTAGEARADNLKRRVNRLTRLLNDIQLAAAAAFSSMEFDGEEHYKIHCNAIGDLRIAIAGAEAVDDAE